MEFSQKKLAAANQLAAASSQQLAVAHPIIQPIHATEDMTIRLAALGAPEHGGYGNADADGVTMVVEDAEHFVSIKHDGIHGAGTSFLDGISIAHRAAKVKWKTIC